MKTHSGVGQPDTIQRKIIMLVSEVKMKTKETIKGENVPKRHSGMWKWNRNTGCSGGNQNQGEMKTTELFALQIQCFWRCGTKVGMILILLFTRKVYYKANVNIPEGHFLTGQELMRMQRWTGLCPI